MIGLFCFFYRDLEFMLWETGVEGYSKDLSCKTVVSKGKLDGNGKSADEEHEGKAREGRSMEYL